MKFRPKFKKFGKLPGKPSELIRLALKDAAKIKDTPGYKLDMNIWHCVDSFVCHVCLAGSIMASSLRIDKDRSTYPSDCGRSLPALWAIDNFRLGQIYDAFDHLGLADDYIVNDIEVPSAVSDEYGPKLIKYLNTLADSLESQGF